MEAPVKGENDVEVEQCDDGWTVRRGRRQLKRFRGGRQGDGLHRACEWGWDYASERGLRAWLKHGDRWSRINFGSIQDSQNPEDRNG